LSDLDPTDPDPTDPAVFPALAASVARDGFRLVALDTTPSTNDEARNEAGSGDARPVWVIAAEQTQGRGRHGRHWSSPRGNLYASLALAQPCPTEHAPQLGFVAGLALHDAIGCVTPLTAPRLALKWPNDLIVDGAKVAGILLEGHRAAAARRSAALSPATASPTASAAASVTEGFTVIVGIGINVAKAPSDTPYRAACLDAVAGKVDRVALFRALSAAMAERLAAWNRGTNFASIRAAWLARAAGIGAPVTVRLPTRDAHGTFLGMDASGRLVLDGAFGREAIDAGDLFFGANPATATPAKRFNAPLSNGEE
jgi:BirA family transcriptional regulator, biotin operon repressor / biotin---[acetyl-CoA-carboxylase] ligase